MRKVLRIQNYLNRKVSLIPIAFGDPYRLPNSNKILIPFSDKLFFQTPIMRLENLLELSNGVYCAEFKIGESLKHLMLRKFLMNLDMTIINKLYDSSTNLFKSNSGRAIQFSKDVIREKYYPGLRYDDTNNCFYLQLIINESSFDRLEEHEEYYLFVEIENIHFHKKLFLCNLRMDSFQKISSDSEDSESDEEEKEDHETENATKVSEAEAEQANGEEFPAPTETTEMEVDQSFVHPTHPKSPDLHDSEKLDSNVSPDMMSQFMELQENLKTKMKEIDTMTQEIKQIYTKMKIPSN